MKQKRWIPSTTALLAVACAAACLPVQAQVTTNLVSNTTFEVDPDGTPRWPWTYTYAGGGPGGGWQDPSGTREAVVDFGYPEGNPTNTVLRFTFDSSPYTPVPEGAWYGFGFGGGMNWTAFDASKLSTNREVYYVSFDAKAEGLLPGTATASGEMQVQMDAPDDTIEPADANGDADRIVQVNVPFEVGTNWTHYRVSLGDGSLGGGAERYLNLYGMAINSMNYNVNFGNAGDDFGFDADNLVYIDNIRLETVIQPASTNPPPPVVAIPILNWNFDDKPSDYNYEYNWSANDLKPVITGLRAAEGYGTGGSNAWILQMDNTELAIDPPAWAGGGTGGGGPNDLTAFTSGDLADYRVTFDARVEGLAPEKNDTTTVLQIFLDAPDDTLQPADDNTDADPLVRLDFQITGVLTNFQNYSFLLSKGSAGSGSKTNFTAHHAVISGLRTQWQIENAASVADWGYDADNVLVIDNVKLDRLSTGGTTPPINISLANGQLNLSWSGAMKLQSAPSIEGPFTDVAGANGSYTTAPTGSARFFKLVPAQ